MDKEANQITYKIKVVGVVQGVGFRPHVYRLAQKHNVSGYVCNAGSYVEITVSSSKVDFYEFLHSLKTDKSGSWDINDILAEQSEYQAFEGFEIKESIDKQNHIFIPHDLSVCDDCLKELSDKKDRRFLNPFISCMSCGPRYTIIEKTPYDRHTTTMSGFEMCKDCKKEYSNPLDRRFHAQTISCNDCGPYLIIGKYKDTEAFKMACELIKSGGIVAVKGVGGYHFCASPYMTETVEKLRKLKGREKKPFAVMFESVDEIKKNCFVTSEEESLLKTSAKPIVLLTFKTDKMSPLTNVGSLYCGAFLPYTPLQMLLVKECGELIMTSANISNRPIIKDDDEIHGLNSPFISGILYNKRRILRSVDDSVVKVINNKPQIIRRSRGYVPDSHSLNITADKPILAAGADLKSTFCLVKDNKAVVSQYFGDLEEAAVFDEYIREYSDLKKLLDIEPKKVVCDMHPLYRSAKFAEGLDLPVDYVQHHHAHIASVMAEHNIYEKVIGVAFDGVGYGTDGSVWGGEFLVCEGKQFKRTAHLKYAKLLGGDTASADAAKTSVCYLEGDGIGEFAVHPQKEAITAALSHNINTALYSSMGRLFDCVCAILGIKNHNSYEGECAIVLEKEAHLALRQNVAPLFASFTICEKDSMIVIDHKPVIEFIVINRDRLGVGALALGFHCAIAEMIAEVCKLIREKEHTNKVCMSGGVFQNSLILKNAYEKLIVNNFEVYYNMSYSPDDSCISLGQAYIGMMG